jgi:GT2 family glycosyltransferase
MTSPRLSVVVPVHNGGQTLTDCLAGLRQSSLPPLEIIVVDDASADDSTDMARRAGVRVVSTRNGAKPRRPCGPARARNLGAKIATGDILVFVDADVMVHADTLARIARQFEENPEIAALFGSYDDEPTASGLVSRYKNLQHHYVHQNSTRVATTFWAGCGAIRREAFAAVGGFSSAFARSSIEDIELGARLTAAGRRIVLCPEILCTHVKQWTLMTWLKTDLFARAIPWTRLLLTNRTRTRELNLGLSSRCSAVLSWILLGGIIGAPVFSIPTRIVFPAGCVLTAINAGFLHLLYRRGGPKLLMVGWFLQWFYYVYSSLIFGLGLIAARQGSLKKMRVTEPRQRDYWND